MVLPTLRFSRCSVALAVLASVTSLSSAQEVPAAKQLEFFESKIRPVLVEHCYRCHGAESVAKGQLKGGLRVDTRQGLLDGGDSGSAVEAGKPAESPLIDALKYESFEMPPAGQLSPEIISDFEKWILDGAVDPRDGTSAAPVRKIDIDAGRQHWAYHPIPVIAPFPAAVGSATAIDGHIDDKLADSKLVAGPAADRRILVRRVYLDLTGLPPTPAEVERFLHDPSPLAYERLVDRLLSSPEFGRHWGRHWLDIVRFAESVTLRGLVQQNAWRYRDYVIESWNRDLPYDQFLREQIAGDLIARSQPSGQTLSESQRRHIATTFLTLTNANLEDQDKEKLRMDVVDEQLNVIGKAFLAQTLGCARCHDHKFDPIPTADYYAMAGILHNTRTLDEGNVSRWRDLVLPVAESEETAIVAKQAQVAAVERRIAALKKKVGPAKPANGRVDSTKLPGLVLDDQAAVYVGAWTRSTSVPIYVDEGYQHDANMAQGEKSATFTIPIPQSGEYEVRFSYTASSNRSSAAEVTVWAADGETLRVINQQKRPTIDGLFVSLGLYQFSKDVPAKVVVSNRNSDGVVIVDAVQLLPTSAKPAKSADKPKASEKTPEEKKAEQDVQKKLAADLKMMETELKQLKAELPPRPMYMGVSAWAKVGDMPIHIRGNVHSHGDVVPRGFLQVATYYDVQPIPDAEEGRVQFADWLAHETNPLPARVMANRVWHWLFGTGLVRSTDNFGVAGEAPSHPELLDRLARTLIDSDWSLKSLIREIVISDVYRRSSQPSADSMAVDPDNRLLWRMNRRRLEAESIQDAILLAAQQLDRTHGGSTLPPTLSADYGFKYESRRRAIYWPQLRNSIPDLIGTFDGADPSLVVGNRNVSSVATQALFMMNNPWVLRQSEIAAQSLMGQSGDDPAVALAAAFQRILGRPPSPAEQVAALEFLHVPQVQSESERLDRWTLLVQSLFSTVDFRFRY